MEKINRIEGLVVPLDRSNVDTDAIIPKQFLKSIKRTGFGPNLFDEWRYLDVGQPGKENAGRPLNPGFVLNEPRYRGAQILLARQNFGCGSSREHAPWALKDYGFRVIIAESFADIFYNNCFKNGLLPVVLPPADLDEIFHQVECTPGYTLCVDLSSQTVTRPDGRVLVFQLDSFRRECLLNGWDEIGLTLLHKEEISAFEEKRRHERPWLFR